MDKLNKMETKYSRTEFEGYTHRFKVEFETKDSYYGSVDIYSNSDKYTELTDFISKSKNENVVSYSITNRTTKEQDELTSKFIDDVLSNL